MTLSMQRIWDSFLASHGEPDLVMAQARALSKQLPILHSILILNVIAASYAHHGIAPDWLTIYVPACLVTLCTTRLVGLVRNAGRPIEVAEARARLSVTNILIGVLGMGWSVWTVLLSHYGNAGTQLYALFSIAIAVTACVFCLMHLRSGSKILGLIGYPAVAYFISADSSSISITALSFASIIGLMMYVQTGIYQDFRSLVYLNGLNARVANIDALTGLPNRRSFFTSLKMKIAEATTQDQTFSIGMIDLDGFKPVNDTFGHQTGDALLYEVGQRLLALSGIDCVARLGGDEFGLIIPASTNVSVIGEAICRVLKSPYHVNGVTAQIGASVGFAAFPETGDSSEQLTEGADFALYCAKTNAPGAPMVYSIEHQSTLRRQSAIEQSLRHADLEAELSLMYQPIVDVEHGRLVAFEALARWDAPRLGRISPADFIPIAERAGLVQRITRTLLPKALADMREWPAGTQLSFNLSTHDISTRDSASHIQDIIKASGVAPSRLILEVTETALMRDFSECSRSLAAFRSMGVAIALDDFGTGYSSLFYLQKLPLDRLKIDRTFAISICQDRVGQAIVKAVVDLCRSMDISCVAEGVETVEQSEALRVQGCSVMQGYLFHRPMTVLDIRPYLAAWAVPRQLVSLAE